MNTTTESPTPNGPGRALTRRGFFSLGIGAVAIASLPVAIVRQRRATRRSMPIMGTVADIVVLSRNMTLAQNAIDASLAELRRVEQLMTRFNASSDIGRANGARIGDPIAVSPETALVVAEALRWADATEGIYDPALGAATQLWDVTHRLEPPDSALVQRLAGRRLYLDVEVGMYRGAPTLIRRDADARFDLGGIAKGYGVDRAAAVLRDWGITNAVVDVGGDLYALGSGVDGGGWRIGIQSPHSPGDIVSTFRLSDAAAATSGTYAQFFTYRGRRYHHLLDPRVAAPRTTIVQSLTIRSDSCLHADVAATTCYGMSTTDVARTLALGPGSSVIRVV